MHIIQKKGNMKIYFETNTYEKLNLCGYYIYAFLPLPVKIGY